MNSRSDAAWRNPGGRTPSGWRRDRWKQGGAADQRPRSRLPRRIAWTAASLALLACLGLLVIPPLFIWHAAVVQLSLDDYELGTLAAVPFGRQDMAAMAAAVDGRLSPAVGRKAVELDRFGTAAALRDQLRATMSALPLRPRDVLIAMLRGQTMVAPPAASGQGPAVATMLAGDLRMAGSAPSEAVACRDVFSAIAAAPPRTALIAIDLGDVRWDPRLGVVGGLVPAMLDRECAAAAAADAADGKKECWVFGSHDLLEFSGVSLGGRRSFFSRALELALAGAADAPRADGVGGDGDGVVELDELVRFTATWTSHWARRESNGTLDQRPVIWRWGVGRVAAADVPPGIAIIRVGRPRGSSPVPTAMIAGGSPTSPTAREKPADPVPTAATPDAAPSQPAAAAGETAAAAPPAVPPTAEDSRHDRGRADARSASASLWELLEAAGLRGSAASAEPGITPLEYAPHLCRDLLAMAAATSATPRDSTVVAGRAEALEGRLVDGLEAFRAEGAGMSSDSAAEAAIKRLAAARAAAVAGGMIAAWKNTPEEVRLAIAVRNRAWQFAWAAASWSGAVTGGVRPSPLTKPLRTLVDRIRGLDAALAAATAPGRGDDQRDDQVPARRAAVESAETELRAGIDEAIGRVLQSADQAADRLPSAELRSLAASLLPSPADRRQIERLCRPVEPSAADGKAPADATVVIDRWLPRTGPSPRLPATAVGVDRTVWQHLAEHVRTVRRLLDLASPPADLPGAASSDIDAAVAAVEAAAADPARAADQAAAVGGLLATALARMPEDVDALLRKQRSGSGDAFRVADSLLRTCDPRDADRVRPDARGWVPAIPTRQSLTLTARVANPQLDTRTPRRVTVALASAAPFPADATIRLEFDPSLLLVRTTSGGPVESGAGLKAAALSTGDHLLLDVTARRPAGVAAGDRKAPLAITMESGRRRERTALPLELPVAERLALAVRGQVGTIDDVAVQNEWLWRSLDPLPMTVGGGSEGSQPPQQAVALRPFPGHVTGWEMAIRNDSGTERRVTIDLVSVDPPDGLVVDGDDESSWQHLCDAIAAGARLPAGARVVASLAELSLAASDRVMPVLLAIPAAAPAPDAAKAGATPTRDTIGGRLAVVVRDLPALNETPVATDGRASRPAAPTRPSRVWVQRFDLVPQHPRRYVDAVARWSPGDRSVTIDLTPRARQGERLPISGARIGGGPLDARVSRSQPLSMRKLEALLSIAQPNDSLRAEWNGVDGGSGYIAVDIDGHPRARVFRVECGAALAEVAQRPQDDWRQVEILQPSRESEFAFLRAPADSIPLRLAIDAPPDAFAGGGTVEVAIRELRRQTGGLAEAERVVWRARADRQVQYVAEAVAPPAAWGVRTTVADWQVPLPGLGFRDVDVAVEARLKMPGDTGVRSDTRRVVLDGSPPRVSLPPRLRLEKGQVGTLPIRAEDGLESTPVVDGRRPGASGPDRAEWGIDLKGIGAPEKWEPAMPQGAGDFRGMIPTETLPLGRYAIMARTFDRVGFESPPARCELEVVAPPPPPARGEEKPAPAAPRLNALTGQVTLSGRPQSGVQVSLTGPSGPTTTATAADGTFMFRDLEPGEYRVAVPESSIKNRLFKAGPQAATVSPPPAAPANVSLQLE